MEVDQELGSSFPTNLRPLLSHRKKQVRKAFKYSLLFAQNVRRQIPLYPHQLISHESMVSRTSNSPLYQHRLLIPPKLKSTLPSTAAAMECPSWRVATWTSPMTICMWTTTTHPCPTTPNLTILTAMRGASRPEGPTLTPTAKAMAMNECSLFF